MQGLRSGRGLGFNGIRGFAGRSGGWGVPGHDGPVRLIRATLCGVGGDPGVVGFTSGDGTLQSLQICAVVRRVGDFINLRGEISGVRGFADIDEDQSIAVA